MTAQNQRYAADTEHVERDDTPAVIVALETLAALADLIHRHRLASRPARPAGRAGAGRFPARHRVHRLTVVLVRPTVPSPARYPAAGPGG
jgi:hypothetical protein